MLAVYEKKPRDQAGSVYTNITVQQIDQARGRVLNRTQLG